VGKIELLAEFGTVQYQMMVWICNGVCVDAILELDFLTEHAEPLTFPKGILIFSPGVTISLTIGLMGV
jgi:hypothetical protein